LKPYLFAFRVSHRSPRSIGILAGCAYDVKRDVIVHEESGEPAVQVDAVRPLVTKKADVEKGEDRKDQWL
jgi:hypothetical protein